MSRLSGMRAAAPEKPHDSSPYAEGYAEVVAVEEGAESRRVVVVKKKRRWSWEIMAGKLVKKRRVEDLGVRK